MTCCSETLQAARVYPRGGTDREVNASRSAVAGNSIARCGAGRDIRAPGRRFLSAGGILPSGAPTGGVSRRSEHLLVRESCGGTRGPWGDEVAPQARASQSSVVARSSVVASTSISKGFARHAVTPNLWHWSSPARAPEIAITGVVAVCA